MLFSGFLLRFVVPTYPHRIFSFKTLYRIPFPEREHSILSYVLACFEVGRYSVLTRTRGVQCDLALKALKGIGSWFYVVFSKHLALSHRGTQLKDSFMTMVWTLTPTYLTSKCTVTEADPRADRPFQYSGSWRAARAGPESYSLGTNSATVAVNSPYHHFLF